MQLCWKAWEWHMCWSPPVAEHQQSTWQAGHGRLRGPLSLAASYLYTRKMTRVDGKALLSTAHAWRVEPARGQELKEMSLAWNLGAEDRGHNVCGCKHLCLGGVAATGGKGRTIRAWSCLFVDVALQAC